MNIDEVEETDEKFRGKKVYRKNYKDGYWRKVVLKSCEYCEDEHLAEVRNLKRDRGKFCGKSCASKSQHEERNQKSHENPNYKGKADFIKNIKKNSECERCGISTKEVLDFHHKNKESKTEALSRMKVEAEYSLEDIKEEVGKCKLLCANCHRLEHMGL